MGYASFTTRPVRGGRIRHRRTHRRRSRFLPPPRACTWARSRISRQELRASRRPPRLGRSRCRRERRVLPGTISAGGRYTPPAAMPSSGTVIVTVASIASPTTTASATVTLLNPYPTVASVIPANLTAAGPFTITVNGSGFVTGAVVMLAGAHAFDDHLCIRHATDRHGRGRVGRNGHELFHHGGESESRHGNFHRCRDARIRNDRRSSRDVL